ncbi:hypothetical protein [Runella zeae]|jgi:hypothetical protein|uniref:hypothetical protein n=1 Tax=Runella zeae TaxID=94255 RepID=UPI000409C8B5|nr:hypothetical protein [Runella zeae]
MKKTILIPTDFSIESLMLLKRAIVNVEADELDIILMFSAYSPDSITELLFYSPKEMVDKLITDDFKEACSILQNKYSSKIASITIEVFHGESRSVFNHLVESRQIQEAFIPKKYSFRHHKNSFDPLPFIRQSSLQITEIEWETNKKKPEKDSIAELFLD